MTTNSIFIGCALATAIFATACTEVGSKDMTSPAKNTLTVENLSNRTVRISKLRWLNSTGESWFTKPVKSGELAPGDTWQTEFYMTGINGDSTFVSIEYDILHDGMPKYWSKGHYGKQIYVKIEKSSIITKLDIARRGL